MDNRDSSDCATMTEMRVSKCPKPFSIESLISRKTPPAEMPNDMPLGSPSHATPSTANTFRLPPNFPVTAGAASIYNPWMHSYLAMQPPPGLKLSGNFFEISSDVSQDKLSEIFAGHGAVDPRIFLGADQGHRDKLLAQYIANNVRDKKFSDFFLTASDYYENRGNAGALLMANGFGGDRSFLGPDSDGVNGVCNGSLGAGTDSGEANLEDRTSLGTNQHMNGIEDGGHGDLIEDDLDSDCSSELSLTMSPGNANAIHGKNCYIFAM